MSAEFIAGFISGVAGLIIGSPFDVAKTTQQSGLDVHIPARLLQPSAWFNGLLAPIFSLGFMNAILFWSYNLVMQCSSPNESMNSQLVQAFAGGLFSGLCVCFVSVPTELIKVKAQVSGRATLEVVAACMRESGPSGFLSGFAVTVLRDSIGYGFYFMAFQGLCSVLPGYSSPALTVLLAGGLAGCISWFSIFPLDTIKTRIQAQSDAIPDDCVLPLLREGMLSNQAKVESGMFSCAVRIWHESGLGGFFKGVWIAMFRAFLVNAVIFYVDKCVKDSLAS